MDSNQVRIHFTIETKDGRIAGGRIDLNSEKLAKLESYQDKAAFASELATKCAEAIKEVRSKI